MNKPTLVILAAGMGSRYGGLKQMDGFGPHNEALLEYAAYDAIRAGFGKVVLIIRHDFALAFQLQFANKFPAKVPVEYVYQELTTLPAGFVAPIGRTKPWGTAHAIWTATSAIATPFAVINGDDFYGAESYQLMADYLRQLPASGAPAGAIAGYPIGNVLSVHGAVSRAVCETDEGQQLRRITERTQVSRQPDGTVAYQTADGTVSLTGQELVSMNMMGFTPAVLPLFEAYLVAFLQRHGQEMKDECLLPAAVNAWVQSGAVAMRVLPTPARWFGVTYPDDKPAVRQALSELVSTGQYSAQLW